jgi:subtilisin family serine protease
VKAIRIIAAALLSIVFLAGSLSAGQSKLNPALRFLKHERESFHAGAHPRTQLAAARMDRVSVTIKFDHVLTEAEIAEYEARGLVLRRFDGVIARTGAIYPASVPWDSLDDFASESAVLRMEAAWRPCVFPLLDVSAHETEADSAWGYEDPLGAPLTGEGLCIADFDTGIDVFHPSFFFADGDTLEWIDVDGYGTFNPGFDCIDLNKNGLADAGELLSYWDGWVYDPAHVWGGGTNNNISNGFQSYWDWLYNDANANATRDYGIGAGYDENDPTYGERLFIMLDTNDNDMLDFGERLVALGTSKIRATLGADSTVYVRGVNLIESEPDDYGHGTPVSGILAGGIPGRHRFTGLAPGAEILMGYFFSDNSIATCIAWARTFGADVMLYEFGGFVWDYLDGSSLDEELITLENESIIQVTPSGNLARGRKHAIATVAAADSVALGITVPLLGPEILSLWPTVLWRTSTTDLTFRLKTPKGSVLTLNGGSYFVDGYYVYYEKSASARGTCALFAYVSNSSNPSCTGTWELKVVNNSGTAIEIIANISDDVTSWAGGAEFLNFYTDDRNVTWPATADEAFVNGSYSTRGFEGYNGVGSGSIPVGEISAFSGRGTRIDGRHLLDIVSPGNYDVYSPRTSQDGAGYPLGSYRQFSGTSAAGPHVAAAAALVQQAFPMATMDDVAFLLTSHAATDAFTGAVYNDTWGWGKLRILGAIGVASDVEEAATGAAAPRLVLGQNYPNPFNPTTWIPFFLPADGLVNIRIYNIRGELVRVLKDRWMMKGAHSVRWNGDNASGEAVASGVYFVTLGFGGKMESRKLVLMR